MLIPPAPATRSRATPGLLGGIDVNKLRILVADNHGVVRRGAREILHARRGWRVVGEAANDREAVEKAIELKPDVAMVDIGKPELNGVDGVEVIRQIREAVPEAKVIVLTSHESGQMVQLALTAGARGYILKSDRSESVVKAVEVVSGGGRFLTPKVSEIVLEGFLRARPRHQQGERAGTRTTPREIEIIRLLAAGKSNKEIAVQLEIGVRTVETHRARIMLKLGLHSLVELIYYSVRHGISAPPHAG
jgi:DNA-binding NarL/FixJ family response regulator